jgi:hypothetical protein
MTGPLSPPPRFDGAQAPFPPEPGFPDWPALLGGSDGTWERAVTAADGPEVLIASNTGLHGAVATLDSVLAVALTLRGARVRFLLCDGILQGCLMAGYPQVAPEVIAERRLASVLCQSCFDRGTNVYRPLGLPVRRLSDHLQATDYAEVEAEVAGLPNVALPQWAPDGVPVGEHAWAGALRYYARGDLGSEPLGEAVARRYLEGGALMARAMARITADRPPAAAVLHHGIYSPQGIAAEVLRRAGTRIATWVVAYRKNCFIFSEDDTYHHTLIEEPAARWEDLALTADQTAAITGYLASRAGGGRDWIYFHKDPDSPFAAYAERVGIDPSKPLVTALTNVIWDAQLHYPRNVFAGMKEWLFETVRWFADRPDLQLLIRVHPAETRGGVKSRQLCEDELRAEFPQMPANVFVAGPDEDLSTYAAAQASDACLIYGTKMGVELAALGLHCIVAGEAWIRGKGLTHDATSPEHYRELLSQLPFGETVARPDRERALRYAYHFFFRRMIPLPFLEPNGSGAFFGLGIDRLEDLAPGRWPGLDVICDGILRGAPFVFPAERLGLHDAAEPGAG